MSNESTETTMNIKKIAEAYVLYYTTNIPHDREEAQLEELGVGHDRLVDILDLHDLAYEADVNAMSEEDYAKAADAAVRDIVSAVGEREEQRDVVKTYKEVIELIGNREFSVVFADGNKLTASCWTDDPEVLGWPAAFDVSASWGDGSIGQYDNLKGELDMPLMLLADEIEQAIPGLSLVYNASNGQLEQARNA